MKFASTLSSSPSTALISLGDVESLSDVDLVLKQSLLGFAEEYSPHLPIIQFPVSEQENVATSPWIDTGRWHLGNSFLFLPFAKKRMSSQISQRQVHLSIENVSFVSLKQILDLSKCYLFSKLNLQGIHGRRIFHSVVSVYYIHNLLLPTRERFRANFTTLLNFPKLVLSKLYLVDSIIRWAILSLIHLLHFVFCRLFV